ncbi:TonB-dependent receptor [Marinimicrobium koreense]|uniref:TonB-dependent receptor n=1 Tax=Marinimicrobium koreense TaxID=306545 RepID=A0A3N1P2E9_9GAMM|nr:TonB-dependent receptor [Marinimicrobium koreense]ROQ21691.1 TonB-dependent receptor [Marinimicrobium koreense]
MYKNMNFKRKLIASAVASCAMSGFSAVALAQESSPALEEVVVTGIRASLEQSMDIKRDSTGVVDAISAEDIGKFPDTNLAESLQRITGVSISRENGEGAEVTVRGFGAGNNMVTLNGRVMPTAGINRGEGGGSRSFDFGNLASEAVSGVEVYKTGKASMVTGGIGATINILTARPLDNPGFNATVGGKAMMDTTNRVGDDVTPELSTLISYSNDDATWGVSLSASHQQRDSGTIGANVNDWGIYEWDSVNAPQRAWNNTDVDVENAPEEGQLYSRFFDLRYEFTDTQRTRDNAQLTLQFAPNEDFTATVDYTFAENEVKEALGQTGNWMQQGANIQAVEFDNQDIATMIYARESYAGGIDEGYEQQWAETTDTLESFGVNFEYQVNDALSFDLDIHDSEMHARGTGPFGTGSVRMALAAPVVTGREWWFGREFPIVENQYDDSINDANDNGVIDPGDVSSTMLNLRQADQMMTVTQVQLDGTYEFDNGAIDFGIESREMESHTLNYTASNVALGGWEGAYPGEFGDLVEPFDIQGEFDDYNPLDGYGFRANAAELYDYATNEIPRYSDILPAPLNQSADNLVNEQMTAAFAQITVNGDLGDMPFNILAGLRYETTDVDSSSLAAGYVTIWESNNDVAINVDPSQPSSLVSAEASYDNLLPSFDFTLNITNDLVGRFSTSKTIARAGLGDLGVSADSFGAGGGSTYLGARPTASASNPGLLPLESTNFDLSLEWYYDDTSYASVGFFEKNVFNFIGSEQVERPLLGIRDVTSGPRAVAAAEELADRGFALNDDNLHGMMVFNEFIDQNGTYNEAWVTEFGNVDYTATQEQNEFLSGQPGGLWDLRSRPEDPETIFRTNTPNNAREAKIHGAEFAVQHFFGDTGFGVQANYTLVRGDVGFDNLGSPDESQFALVGLSDTANLVGLYENYGFQARIAYNWRDKYLNETNRGAFANPRYIEDYSQIDVSVSYEIIEDLFVSFEGLNITGEDSRSHGRNYEMMWDLRDLGPRYTVGARYSF